ncbi:MAG: galactokinase [Clostridia bacterium]|nr:galactokinase [Clostridia bacterium]
MTETCARTFERLFGRSGQVGCFAPGRVNLIGEHTDYNGGHVLPCAIEQGIVGVAARRDDRRLRLYSLNFEEAGVVEVDLDDPRKTGTFADYPAGVARTLLRFGYDCGGADMIVGGDLPNGAGLSSSAAVEILTVILFRDLYALSIPAPLAAVIGQFAEQHFAGVQCGIMDQYAVATGESAHVLCLNTDTLTCRRIPFPAAEFDLVLVNSLVKRELATSAYNERRSECEKALALLAPHTGATSLCGVTADELERYGHDLPPLLYRRARHVITENERVLLAAAALTRGDIAAFGALMNESHRSLCEDYEVSCPELDFLVKTAQAFSGVLGSRMTGAGFGGCTVSLVEKARTDAFATHIKSAFTSAFGAELPVYVTRPSDGARVLFRG